MQRTAYGLRLSYWSADVCCSGLRFAARVAWRAWAAPMRGTAAMCAPVAGLVTAMVCSEPTHWPSIRHCVRSSETSCKFSMSLTPSACDVEAAVDVDDLARDEAGRAAAQEADHAGDLAGLRSEEHTSELQSLMRTTYAVSC